jgi:hypothetical protein
VSLGVLQVMVKVRKKRVRKGEKLEGVGCAARSRSKRRKCEEEREMERKSWRKKLIEK